MNLEPRGLQATRRTDLFIHIREDTRVLHARLKSYDHHGTKTWTTGAQIYADG